MKRKAKRSPQSRLHIDCPFCGHPCDATVQDRWCASCYVEYWRTRSGDFMFDDRRRTPGYAVAKAWMKAGGSQLAEIEIDE